MSPQDGVEVRKTRQNVREIASRVSHAVCNPRAVAAGPAAMLDHITQRARLRIIGMPGFEPALFFINNSAAKSASVGSSLAREGVKASGCAKDLLYSVIPL